MESWRLALEQGDAASAWDLFIDRYRRLIISTIRRTLDAPDDVADVFAEICHALFADDLKLLRRFAERADARASFSTWLVVVVRNRTTDWLRRRSGRRQATAPASLSPLQREIFHHVFAARRSHAETYEIMKGGVAADMSFGRFLREVAATYRRVDGSSGRSVLRYLNAPAVLDLPTPADPQDSLHEAEARARLSEVLEALAPETRLAVQLFVVDEMAAADVARTLGWKNAKQVYNRVSRALVQLRQALERQGIHRWDL
jgi:RNA polymerase sigma factor (sigma-70 family)